MTLPSHTVITTLGKVSSLMLTREPRQLSFLMQAFICLRLINNNIVSHME